MYLEYCTCPHDIVFHAFEIITNLKNEKIFLFIEIVWQAQT